METTTTYLSTGTIPVFNVLVSPLHKYANRQKTVVCVDILNIFLLYGRLPVYPDPIKYNKSLCSNLPYPDFYAQGESLR